MRILIVLTLLTTPLLAQWTPGQVYREYLWVTPADHNEAFLRVGGRFGYAAQPGKLPDSLQQGDQLIFPQSLDLTGATRATLTFEKIMGHEDSRDLQVAVNGHAPLSVPEPTAVPEPQTEYMYHTDVSVEVPFGQLHDGHDNRFRLTLDTAQRWGWPQNLFYAVILRVYYPDEAGPEIDYPLDEVPATSYLYIKDADPTAELADFIFVGRDVDWSGRGVQDRKHWQSHRGQPLRTIGRSTDASTNFATAWNTEWLPNQPPFGVQARVRSGDGKYRVSSVRSALTLTRRPYTVAVYGGEAPRNWVTRSGAFEQTITVADSIQRATALRVNWVSWSPCYGNGVFLNGHLIWDRSHDDCYVFATHAPEYTGHDVQYLQRGENVISTALTPLFRGQMVHGMEVQWPGVQLLVRYGD